MADQTLSARITAEISDFQSKMQAAADAGTSATDTLSSSFEDAASRTSAATDQVNSSLDELAAGAKQSSEQAAESVRSASEAFGEAFNQIRESAMHVVETLALLEGIHLFVDAVREGAEMGEQLERLSEITGASVENLSRLKFAADATGTPFGALTAAIRRTSMELAQINAGQGSKALQQAMVDLKLSAKDLEDFPLTISRIADATEHMSAAAIRADATALLGRGGVELIPLIRNWKELRDRSDELGATLSGSVVEGAARGQEAMNVLGAEWDAAKVRLANDLEPAIRFVIKALEGLVQEVSTLAARGDLEKWAERAVSAANRVGSAIGFALGISSASHISELNSQITNTQHNIEAVKDSLSGWHLGTSTDDLNKKLKGYQEDLQRLNAQLAVEQNLKVGTIVNPEPKKQAGDVPESGGPFGFTRTADVKAAEAAARKAAAAAHKAAEEQLQAFTEEQKLEVAEAQNNAVAKIGAIMQVTQKAKELFGEQSKEYRKALVEQQEAVNQFTTQQTADQLRQMDLQRQQAADAIALAQEAAKQKAALADITATKSGRTANQGSEVAEQQKLESQLHKVLLDSFNQELALDNLKVVQKEKINSEIEKEERRHNTAMGQLAIQAAKVQQQQLQQSQHTVEAIAGHVDQVFTTLFNNLGRGSRGLSIAFERLGVSLGESLLSGGIKEAFGEIFTLMKTGVMGHAASAAAAAFDWVMQEVPFPVNIGLAPAAAAAAFAGVAAFQGLIPSAAGGWDVPTLGPQGAMTQIHSREMVLPANIADQFRGGSTAQGPAARGANVNFTFTSMDPREGANYLRRNKDQVHAALTKSIRNGRGI
jgi:hypothetical protein